METLKTTIININSNTQPEQYPLSEVKINFPNNDFSSLNDNEFHRLTLTSFKARRNWGSVNASNNTFYIFNAAHNLLHTLTIPEGDYATGDKLVEDISGIISSNYAGAAVSFDGKTKKISIDMGSAVGWTSTNYFASTDTYDTYKLLGGNFTPANTFPNGTSKTPLFNQVGDVFTSITRSQLSTQEDLLVYCLGADGANFTSNTERDIGKNGKLVNSNLLGRIPLMSDNNQELKDVNVIYYTDNNNNYQVISKAPSLGALSFQVLDRRGLPIKSLIKDATDRDNLDFSIVLKYELVKRVQMPTDILLGCVNDKRGNQMIDARQDLMF
tara:strand:- start:7332 stop:8312 length:981 start_codon:yes stop_codon:yes gene_type:complete